MQKFCALLTFSIFTMTASVVSADGVDDKIAKACGVCHNAGVAGAPKIGDKAAWEPRLAKGIDVLVGSVTNGKGAMPPKGLCNDCTADDFKAIIKRMSGQ